jgi:hypothetical protein
VLIWSLVETGTKYRLRELENGVLDDMTQATSNVRPRNLLLTLIGAALLGVGSHSRPDARWVSTQMHWRDLQHWSVGWRRVAYCSEQAAAFRGWEADCGPISVLHLKSTLAVVRIVQSDGGANRGKPDQ